MPDWLEFVRRRVGTLEVGPRREAEIIAELADHHADLFEDRCREGLGEVEAEARAGEEVSDWREFRDEIRCAELEEVLMDYRSRSLWLPGLITLTLSSGLFWMLETHGVHMRIPWLNNPALMFSLPWTLSLPIVGALGALISRRLGGRPRESLLAGLFPSATMCAFFVLVAPLALLIDADVPKTLQLYGFAGGMLAWVIIPGTALLVGALPVAMARRHESAPSNVQA
jgi:hypothetical protein